MDEASGDEMEGDDEVRALQPRLLALVRAASGEPVSTISRYLHIF